MIEIHSIFGLCLPADMELADIEHCSIPETDTPGINKTNCPAGNADNSPSTDEPSSSTTGSKARLPEVKKIFKLE